MTPSLIAQSLLFLAADNAALQEQVKGLVSDLAEANRKLGGGCDANAGGDHLVIKQGTYAFCGNCGESLRGVRFCHLPLAAVQAKETGE